MLYRAVLCCRVLYRFVSCCIMLYYAVLRCICRIRLICAVMSCDVLYRATPCCAVLCHIHARGALFSSVPPLGQHLDYQQAIRTINYKLNIKEYLKPVPLERNKMISGQHPMGRELLPVAYGSLL